MWYDLAGSSRPDEIDTGNTYFFGMVTTGSWSLSDFRTYLETDGWTITSIHPGEARGLYKAWQVLARWDGPNSTILDTANVSFAGIYIWVADSVPMPPPELPTPTLPDQPPSLFWPLVGLSAVGLTLGFVAFRSTYLFPRRLEA